jgi:uncharacterized membrane protein YkoI
MRDVISAGSALAALALFFSPIAHAGDNNTGYYSGYELSKDAQITMEEASMIALKIHPRGVIINRVLAREPGGTGLRYTFSVVAQARSFEVGVDAGSGDVIEDQLEVR